MVTFSKGDLVARKSYLGDIFFKIVEIVWKEGEEPRALLKGLDVRLLADAPLTDLEKVSLEQVRSKRRKFVQENRERIQRLVTRGGPAKGNTLKENEAKEDLDFFEIPGTVLHLDGDPEYLKLCLDTYKEMKIKAHGLSIKEEKQPEVVLQLLQEFMPDILVLTGHDGLLKGQKDWGDINSYRTSKYFVEAVKRARTFEKSKDDLIIFAGACQSYFEAILRAGANFASSPQRILIHAFDPVLVVEKLAFTPIDKTVAINDVIKNTISGANGVGGVQSKGRFRLGLPKSPY
ncbi:MAG: sporulation peptidase YabG [Clostridia bacterium]|nr:sporulation peptidase YabG [Clostridia bacterium]